MSLWAVRNTAEPCYEGKHSRILHGVGIFLEKIPRA